MTGSVISEVGGGGFAVFCGVLAEVRMASGRPRCAAWGMIWMWSLVRIRRQLRSLREVLRCLAAGC